MVYILLAPGCEEAEVIVPADLLRRGGVDAKLVSLEGDTVLSSRQFGLKADCLLSDVSLTDEVEMVVVPGGLGGVQAIKASARAGELLTAAAEKGLFVAAICAGPTVLADLGLLKGKKATCYPGMEDQLTGATPVFQEVVVDGKVITSQAAGTAFPFGLALLEALRGRDAAEKVRRSVHYKA